MEKNINVDTYLTLSKSGIDKTSKKANKKAIDEYGKEDGEDELLYQDCIWDVDELYFDGKTQELMVSGEIFHNGVKIGYLAPNIKIGYSTVIEIMEHYVEKLNKIKAILND